VRSIRENGIDFEALGVSASRAPCDVGIRPFEDRLGGCTSDKAKATRYADGANSDKVDDYHLTWRSKHHESPWIAASEGDELVEEAGVGGHRYGRIESGGNATFCGQGLPRQAKYVSGVGIRRVEGTV
jgi:hypothetical protein